MLQDIKIYLNACIQTIYKGCSIPAALSEKGKEKRKGVRTGRENAKQLISS